LLEVFKNLKTIVSTPGEDASQEELLKDAKRIVHDICKDHAEAGDTYVHDPQLREALKAETETECQLLIEYLEAAKRFKLECNSRAKDRVVSFGEKLSCRFMACVLKDRVSHMNARHCCAAKLTVSGKGGCCGIC
jgi:aspartate kinase